MREGTMTVSELKKLCEEAEAKGLAGTPVIWKGDAAFYFHRAEEDYGPFEADAFIEADEDTGEPALFIKPLEDEEEELVPVVKKPA
jgi:hypothetical protein